MASDFHVEVEDDVGQVLAARHVTPEQDDTNTLSFQSIDYMVTTSGLASKFAVFYRGEKVFYGRLLHETWCNKGDTLTFSVNIHLTPVIARALSLPNPQTMLADPFWGL